MPLTLQLTNAGLDAIVDAGGGGTDDVFITQIGLTEVAFAQAPTLTAIPGEFKRLDTLAGQEVAPNVIHMTGYDTSADVYDVRGFGLYLDDGTLFATHSAADPVLSKAELAFGLFSLDVAFSDDVAGAFSFGDNVFLYPPATETVRGVARLATQARVDAGADGADDAETIVTPKTLRARLSGFWDAVTAAIIAAVAGEAGLRANADAALGAKTVTGIGLVTGGGPLSGNPVLGVTAATLPQLLAEDSNTLAITPGLLGLMPRGVGFFTIPGTANEAGHPIMVQCVTGAGSTGTSEATQIIAFPTAFQSEVLGYALTTKMPAGDTGADTFFQVVGDPTLSDITVQRQVAEGGGGTVAPHLIIIGR